MNDLNPNESGANESSRDDASKAAAESRAPSPSKRPSPGRAARRKRRTRQPVVDRYDYYLTCTKGLEGVLANEARELGGEEVEEARGGVRACGDLRFGYAACLWLRTATRVQRLILECPIGGVDSLYRHVNKVDWSHHMRPQQTLAIDASVRDSRIRHSKYAALKAKDAIVDQFRKRRGRRPNVDAKQPDLPLKLAILEDVMSIYADLSGHSLHKRGWRPIQVKSPLNEALAAGLVLLSNWDRQSPLADPMCGSGTIAIEAAHLALDRAPGLHKRFAFMNWPDYDAEAWRGLFADARERERSDLPFKIECNDHHEGALTLAKRNAENAKVTECLRFRCGDARTFPPTQKLSCVITNPPYGERLGAGKELRDSWKSLGNFLHRHVVGGTAYVLSGNPDLPKLLGLRAQARIPLMNGSIDCRLLVYEIHEAGSTAADHVAHD